MLSLWPRGLPYCPIFHTCLQSLRLPVLVALSILLICQLAKMLWYCCRNLDAIANMPPGSQGLPFIGETLQFWAAINRGNGFYEFVQIRRQRYGNCFKTNIFGETHVFVSSVESTKAILNNDSGKFTKKYIKSIAELVGNKSLLCASPHHHKLIRSHLMSLFSSNSVSLFIKQFDELVVSSLSNWENKATVSVLDEALKITLQAMCKLLMSIEDGKILEMLQEDIANICAAMLAFPVRFPWTRFCKGLKMFCAQLNDAIFPHKFRAKLYVQRSKDALCQKMARKRIMNTMEMMMTERRRSQKANQEDFLQQLLRENGKASSDEAFVLTDAEIKDNILTMIIAGQDTTASAIAWMAKYLGENQHVLDTLRAEQFRLAENTSVRSFLTLEDLSEMPYSSRVVKESLRMASIVAWLPRLALQDCEIEGFKVRKGWNINVDARSIHLDHALYNDPNKFNPSRFDDDAKPYSFLAFGMGARTCLGLNMARSMMLVFLHRLVTTYEWRVIDSDPTTEKWALFSRLKSGCPIHVTRVTKSFTPNVKEAVENNIKG